MSFNRELLIGVVIGVALYWAYMHFAARGKAASS